MEIEITHNPNYKDVIQWIQEHNYPGCALDKLGIKDTMTTSLENQTVNKNLAFDAEIHNQYDFLLIPNEELKTYEDLLIN